MRSEDGSTHHACNSIPFGQNVCKLDLGVHIFDVDFGVEVNSVEQPIHFNSVNSGYMSHCWTSAFDKHIDYCLVVLKNVKCGTGTRRFHV